MHVHACVCACVCVWMRVCMLSYIVNMCVVKGLIRDGCIYAIWGRALKNIRIIVI